MDMPALIKSRHDPNWQFYVPREDYEHVPVKGHRNGLRRVNGHLIPNLVLNLSVVKSMDVRDDDTFVVTHIKSGTNWVAELCWLIQHNCDTDRAKKENHMMRSVFLDMCWSNDLLNLKSSPRVFQTHLRHCFLPDNIENRAKVIYVVRNPKDVIVSLYFFNQNLPEDQFDGNIEDMFEDFVKGEVMYGAWWDHVNEFTKINNIHLIHFEDLLEDGINETRKLANFLGKDLSNEQLKEIVDFCSFDSLKKNKVFEVNIPAGLYDKLSNKPPEVKLLRKGQIGDWKNYFTEEMSKAIDEMVTTKLEYKRSFKFEPSIKYEEAA